MIADKSDANVIKWADAIWCLYLLLCTWMMQWNMTLLLRPKQNVLYQIVCKECGSRELE